MVKLLALAQADFATVQRIGTSTKEMEKQLDAMAQNAKKLKTGAEQLLNAAKRPEEKDKGQTKQSTPPVDVELGGKRVNAYKFLCSILSLAAVEGWMDGRNAKSKRTNDPDLVQDQGFKGTEKHPQLYVIGSSVVDAYKPGFSIATGASLRSRYETSFGPLDCMQTFKLDGKHALEIILYKLIT